jgi:ERCC4-type nuclease
MFNSEELKNATETLASITTEQAIVVDSKNIKNEIKRFLLIKNSDLIKSYDYGYLMSQNDRTSNEYLKYLLNIIKDLYLLNYKDNTNKCLIIRKIFDNISNNLDCLSVSEINNSSEEINAAILGLINRNFL